MKRIALFQRNTIMVVVAFFALCAASSGAIAYCNENKSKDDCEKPGATELAPTNSEWHTCHWDTKAAICTRCDEINCTIPSPRKGLKFGDTGEPVKTVQTSLKQMGYLIMTDGVFGNKTKQSVMTFQRKNGLPVTGTVDDKTLEALGK